MMKTNKLFWYYGYLLVILAVVFLVGSCNLFQWANPKMTGTAPSDLIARGDQSFSAGNYQDALVDYSNAIAVAPGNSKARIAYVRAFLWYSIPDLLILLSKQPNLNTSGIINFFNDKDAQKIIFREGNRSIFRTIVDVLDSPDGILNEKGDKQVPIDNMEFNQLLLLGYLGSLFMEAMDSSRDGTFAGPGDFLVTSNDNIVFSLDIIGMISNMMSLTNISTSMSLSNVRESLHTVHNESEDILTIGRFIYTELDYVNKIIQTVIRPSSFLKKMPAQNPYYPNYYAEIRDAATNINAPSEYTNYFKFLLELRDMPDMIGSNMNELHNVLVGSYAYSPSANIGTFAYSSWNSHSGGLKGAIDAAIAVADLTNNIDITNVTNIIANITNTLSPEDITNILKKFFMN